MARIATTDQPPTRHMPPRRTDHGGRGPAPGGCPDSPVGRWAGDVSRTAWTLYVRYNQAAGDQWTRKWEYRESWEEWRQAPNPG